MILLNKRNDEKILKDLHQQNRILKAFYPEHTSSDYVVWISPQIDMRYEGEVKGIVSIIRKDSSVITHTYKTLYCEQLRHILISYVPKSNKKKAVKGVPFVFKTREELEEISHIMVTWILYIPDNIDYTIQIIQSTYYPNFEFSNHCRSYSLCTYDCVDLGIMDDDTYIDEFENTFYSVSNEMYRNPKLDAYYKPMQSYTEIALRTMVKSFYPISGQELLEYFVLDSHVKLIPEISCNRI